MSDLHFQTISNLAPRIARKEISPVELLDSVLHQIQAHNDDVNAYITILEDESREAAKKAEREIAQGKYRGPLHGIPMGLKDLFYTAGIRTTAGSAILKDFVPDTDATVVRKLKDAGVILTGKLNMHEYAFGATNENPHYGPSRNPWDTARMTGGSSGGGGAAVAAGLSVATLGTDTGGSIRTPSALCGIVGLKPTFGRVSKHGVVPLSWSLDHVGPMARSVADAAVLLQAIAGFDPQDAASKNAAVDTYAPVASMDAKTLVVGVPGNYYFDGVDPQVEANVRAAIAALAAQGARVVEVSIPELALAMFAELVTISAEASAYHHDTFTKHAREYGADVRVLLEGGELLTAVQYLKAQQSRRLLQEAMLKVLSGVDVLVAPTLPFTAPPIGEGHVEISGQLKDFTMECVRFAAPCNLTGFPSLSLPVGFSSAGLPIGMQIIGKPFDEVKLLQVGALVEQVAPFEYKNPVLSKR